MKKVALLLSTLCVAAIIGCGDDGGSSSNNGTNNGANNGNNNGANNGGNLPGCLPDGDGAFAATLSGEVEAVLALDNADFQCSGSATATTVVNLGFTTKVPGTEDDLGLTFGLDGLTEGALGAFPASVTLSRGGATPGQWSAPAGACMFTIAAQETYETTVVGNLAKVEGSGDCTTALDDGAVEVHGVAFTTRVVFPPQ